MIGPKGLAALGALALSTVAFNASAGVGKGDFEAGVSISITNTEITVSTPGGDFTTESDAGTIAGNFGYFFLDWLEAKAAISSTITNDPTTGDMLLLGVFTPGADFVFLGQGKVAPFVGASYGLSFGDTDAVGDTDYYEGHGGVKFFIQERSSLELKLTRYEATESTASGRTEFAVGLNVYF